MKDLILKGIGVALTLSLVLSVVVAKDIYVSPKGSDTTNDGTQAAPFLTITKAMSAAESGDRILLAAGDYTSEPGTIVVKVSVSLESLSGESDVTIFVSKASADQSILAVIASKVNLANIRLNGQQGTATCLAVDQSTVILTAVDISECTTADAGAAVLVSAASILKAANCSFAGNNAGNRGGAVHCLESTVEFTNCGFSENKAGYGGALYNEGGVASVAGSEFAGNTAVHSGGAVQNDNSLALSSVTFTLNTAYDGGAIFNADGLSVADCTFLQNTARDSGAALFNQGGNVTLAGANIFSYGNATAWGGAIYNQGGEVSITSGLLTNNTAGYGGAIHNDQGVLRLIDTSLEANSAEDAGAIFSSGVLTAENVVITSSSAQNGGGVYLLNGAASFSGCTFTNNQASITGGGAYIQAGSCSFDLSAFSHNCAPNGATFFINSGTQTSFTSCAVSNGC